MLLRLIFNESGDIDFEYELVHQNDAHVGVKFMSVQQKIDQENEIKRLNRIIADDNTLNQEFDLYCRKLQPIMLSRIQPYQNKFLIALNKRGFLPDLMNKIKKRMIKIYQNVNHIEKSY